MIKNVAFLSATVAMLILSGCSTKAPAIDATANASTTSTGTQADSNAATATGTDANAAITPVSNAVAPTAITPVSNIDAGAAASAANGANGSDGQLISVLFDFDKYNIRSDMEGRMSANAALLKTKSVKLEGNCDEFGSDEYNFALGLRRASTVKEALINSGMNGDSISMASLGEGNPVCLEKNKECWAKNRRVDFKLP
ncbi:MAG: OmpA family protein [Sulfuricurvum sp.]|uniref:OmpA family protein n=1 Tax=Sulfuricurvum sp. TaxID=2025608 RepID=UPI0025CF64D9|nr:OmpA family protein [Sulfuricurvum sp.]MCK9373834.1 OmpA family protein [Sulfuricurvum sp.]